MKVRFFVVDRHGQLRKAGRSAVHSLWRGECGADALGCAAAHELHLVSVVCDAKLLPRKVYLLRLPLLDGRFNEASYLTLQAFTRPDCVTRAELVEHSAQGWPEDFFRQLAVALDVPVAALDVPFDVGGPLFLAAALDVSPREALRYLD